MPEHIIEACNISQSIGDVCLIDNSSLTLSSGKSTALVGSSGSGKTVLLRALALLNPIDSGEILWKGKSVSDSSVPKYRSNVIYMHQRPTMIEGTVEDNLRLPFSFVSHLDKSYNRTGVIEQLKSLGLNESFLDKNQDKLSGGESQITALLRSIQLDPQVLLLDEPTSALDAEKTTLVEDLISNWLKDTDRALLWVTHDLSQVKRICSEVLQIQEGKILQEE